MTGSKDQFTGKMFVRLWAPAMISSAGWALSDMADAIVVGQRLGAVGLAAISLVLPVYMLNCMFAHSFGLGGSIRFSGLLGAGKKEEAVASFNGIMQVAMGISVLVAVLGNLFMEPLLAVLGTTAKDGLLYDATKEYLRILVSATPLFFLSNLLNYYLRNDDNAKLAGIGSAVGNVSDIILNIVFVLVLQMGTGGAALATLVGQVIAIAFYLPGIFGKAHSIQLRLVPPKPREAFNGFKIGFVVSVQYLFQWTFLLLCNNVLIRISGQTGLAVFDMIQNASYLILYLYEGTSRAMQPLVSTYHGEHFAQGEKNTLKYALAFGSASGAVLIFLVALFPGALCALFGLLDPATMALGQAALRIYCMGSLCAGISILLGNYFGACENEGRALLIVLLRGGLVLLPCTLLFARLGIDVFWWLFPCTEILSLGLYLLYLKFGKKPAHDFDFARVYTRTIRAGNFDEIGATIAQVEAFCERWDASPKQSYFVTMATEELCVTITQNGFEGEQDGYLQLTLIATEDEFELHIRDNARHFDPFSLHTAKAGQDTAYDMDAMGMLVIKQKAKWFFYRRYQGFNSLVVRV